MKNLFSKIAVLLSIAFVISFTACMKKENANDPEFAAEDNTNSNAASDEVIAVSESSMSKGESSMSINSDSRQDLTIADDYYKGTITITPKASLSDSGRIVIDFGTGVKGMDGRTRKGKINIAFTGRYRDAGKVQVVTLDNFYVDGKKIEGKKVLTHTIVNNTVETKVVVTGGKLTYTDGTFTTWTSERKRIWDPKGTLADYSDDVVTVSGNIAGITRNNIPYVAVVDLTSPLVYTYTCFLQVGLVPVSGKIVITPGNSLPRTIDFGSGACDREATFNVANKTITFTIK